MVGLGGAGTRWLTVARGVVATVVLAVLVGACGDSGDDGSAVVAGTTVPPASSATAPAAPSEVPLEAEDFVLTEGPETAGFIPQPPTPDDSSGPDLEAIGECLGIPAERIDRNKIDEADGDDFVNESNDIVTVGSEAQIVSASKIATDREMLRHPQFGECFGAEFERVITEENTDPDLSYEIVSVEVVEPPAGATGAMRISMGITYAGETVGVVFDSVFVFEGRVEASILFLNVDEPMPADVVEPIVEQVVTKVDNQ